MITQAEGQGSLLSPPPFDDRPGKLQRDAHATSVKAARDLRGRSGTIRRRVHHALYARDMTDQELWHALGGAESSARKRRQELLEDGLVQDSGARRPTDNAQDAIVWCLTERGRAMGTEPESRFDNRGKLATLTCGACRQIHVFTPMVSAVRVQHICPNGGWEIEELEA